MKLSREKLRRMFDQNTGQVILGGGGGGDVDLTGVATEAWVEENYLSKAFFTRLFKAYGPAETEGDPDVEVEPNDLESDITSIEAMFGFWTEQYISALGHGSGGGGGGGGSDTLADLIDVELTNPVAGQVLKYNGTKWINSAASAGTVTSVALSVPTGFNVTGSPITSAGVLGITFATGYSLPTTASQTNWDAAYSWTSQTRTTLADYGITDAKFGTPGTDSIPITLGSTTQSVLTQHQSLANYYTKSETDGKFLTISFFRSLFKAYNSSDVEVQPNDGSTSTIASIKAMFGFWTEQYISALGQSSGGGGGVTLNQPLQGINQAGLSAPTRNGSVLVYNNGWKYSYNAGIATAGITSTGIVSASGFSATGKDDTYVLLAGGGTKLLSEIGGTGSVVSVSINGTSYLPDANGDVNLGSGYLTGYTDTKNTAGSGSVDTAAALYLIGAKTRSATGVTTYSNANCYIGASDNCLYSNGSKVLTGITSTMVTTALGFTPAASSDLANYLPLSGGTLTGDTYIGNSSNTRNLNLIFRRNGDTYYVGAGAEYLWLCFRDNNDSANDNNIQLFNNYSTFNKEVRITGSLTATSIVKSGGTSSQFLKADGSVDSNTYLTSSSLSGYLPLSGGTITGLLSLESYLVIWDSAAHNCDFDIGWRSGYVNMYAYENNQFYDICIGRTTSNYSLYFDASAGSWGVNTDSPTHQLHVNGTFYASGNSEIGGTLSVAGALTATGGVIGNASSATKLQTERSLWGESFDGTADIPVTSNISAKLIFFRKIDNSGNAGYCGRGSSSHDGIQLVSYSAAAITINNTIGSINLDTAGNVGIGTTSPSYKLDVFGNAQFGDGTTRKARFGSNENYASLTFVDGSNNNVGVLTLGGAATDTDVNVLRLGNGDYSTVIRGKDVNVCYGSSNTSAIYVNTSGNIGIGTTSPTYMLDVNGISKSRYIMFRSIDGGNAGYCGRGSSSNNGLYLSSYSNDSVRISNTAGYLFINSSGNIGIDTTSPSEKLHVNGNVRIGDAVLVWDSTNEALKVQKSDGTAASFYATGSVSALGSSSSGTTYLDQATADARYLKLSGGTLTSALTVNGNFTSSSTIKGTSGLMTAYMTVGTSSVNSSYTLYVNGTAKIKNLTITDITGTNNETRLETSNALLRLKASASVYANNTLISSDMRMKHIRSYASAGIEQIANAPVFNFVFTDAPQYVHLGTSAQYWQTIFPCAVDTMPDTYLAMDYGSIALASAVMVARKVQSHEERIAALEAENARLQKELNEIKAA